MSLGARASAWIGLAVVAAAVGWPACAGGLIRDDVLYTVGDPFVTEPVDVGDRLSAPLWPYEETGLYRPFTTWTFRLDWVISQAFDLPMDAASAPVPHAQNLIWNAAAGVLFGLLLIRLSIARGIALVAAAVFAVHPARSEAVLWISGRAELVMTTFGLAALFVLARAPTPRWSSVAFAALLASGALLGKEQGATLLLIAPLVPGLSGAGRMRVLLAMAAGLLPWLVVRHGVLGAFGPTGVQQVLLGVAPVDMVLHALEWVAAYGRLLFVPVDLRHEYPEPVGHDGFLVSIALLSLLVACGAWWRVRGRWGFALAWFFVAIVPALNVAHRSSEVFAERFLSFPAGGVVLLGALTLQRFVPRRGAVMAAFVAVACGIGTWSRAHDYRSMEALFDRDPALVGQRALLEGRATDAIEPLTRALRKQPHNVVLNLALCRALIADNGAGDARDRLLQLTESYPQVADAWALLGDLEKRIGRPGAAMSAYRRAVDAEARDWRPAWELASLLASEGRVDEARRTIDELVEALEAAARDRPWDYQPLTLAGRVLSQTGRPDQALPYLNRALGRALRARDIAGVAALKDAVLAARGPEAVGARTRAILGTMRRIEEFIGTGRPQDLVFVALADLARMRGDLAAEQRFLRRGLEAAREPAMRSQIRARLSR